MKMKNFGIFLPFLFSVLFISAQINAQANEVTVGDVRWGDVVYKGFNLYERSTVQISGEGA